LKREKIKAAIVRTLKNYGFEPAETPIIEYEEFVKGENQNDEAISDIFKLQDKGKRNLALRYEFTFQLKRIARNRKLPYKRYQIGEVFRDEPTSQNRFRQFTQSDADIVGATIKDEAEILSIANKISEELGIKVSININNRKLLNEILDKEKITSKSEVIKEIDKIDKLPEKDIKSNLRKYNAERLIEIFNKPESFFSKYDFYKEIEELKKYCSYYKTKVNFLPSLARGLSYYTGSVFEIKTQEMKETIIAGGTYNINGIPATGISFGIERISLLAKTKIEENRILIISIAQEKKAIDLAEKLRAKNIPVIIMYKITNALEFANSTGIPYVIFIGEQEIKEKKLKLRNMKTGKEELLPEEKIERIITEN
jgi:histidyl-tRNA synthetase